MTGFLIALLLMIPATSWAVPGEYRECKSVNDNAGSVLRLTEGARNGLGQLTYSAYLSHRLDGIDLNFIDITDNTSQCQCQGKCVCAPCQCNKEHYRNTQDALHLTIHPLNPRSELSRASLYYKLSDESENHMILDCGPWHSPTTDPRDP